VLDYEFVRSRDRLPAIAREIERTGILGFDIETTNYEPYQLDRFGKPADIRLLSLNTGAGIYVVDLWQTGGPGPLLDAIASEDVIKIVQNAKFEQKWFLQKYNVELWPIFDTWRASVLIHNGRDLDHHIWALYERELNLPPTTEDLGGSDWANPNLTQEQIDYSAEDAVHLLKLRDKLKPQLGDQGLFQVALLEFGAVLPEAAIELNGLNLDPDMWLELAAENVRRAEAIRKSLVWKMPNPKWQMALPGIEPGINLNSPPQVLGSLRKLGGNISNLENTREITLAMFAAQYPVIKELLEYRTYAQRVKSFGAEYLRHIDPLTGRIHSSYFPFTGAGRYASSNPNLQQIPREKAFRACFKAAFGKRIVAADYSNIEMRLAAQIANDKKLIEIFNSADDDAHRATAALLASKTLEEVTKGERQEAKPVNFGLIYGMQAAKLVMYAMANYGVAMTPSTAKKYRKAFFGRDGYYGVAKWHEFCINVQKPMGYTKTLAGRIRYLEKEEAHNEFYNTPVQGSGADGLKRALREVYFRLKKISPWNGAVKMVHHVHDEIMTEIDDNDELDRLVRRELQEGMREGMARYVTKVPVKVEPESGDSWGTAKS
jgi:DNA polymerase I-like protein with 3'-5' exonuclease and polymerase domains